LIWSKTLEDKSKKSIEKCELNRQNYHDKTNKQATWITWVIWLRSLWSNTPCGFPVFTSKGHKWYKRQQRRTAEPHTAFAKCPPLPPGRRHVGSTLDRWVQGLLPQGSKAHCRGAM
jgi:hypothetical protein